MLLLIRFLTLKEQNRVGYTLSFRALHCCVHMTGYPREHLRYIFGKALLQGLLVVTEDFVILEAEQERVMEAVREFIKPLFH